MNAASWKGEEFSANWYLLASHFIGCLFAGDTFPGAIDNGNGPLTMMPGRKGFS